MPRFVQATRECGTPIYRRLGRPTRRGGVERAAYQEIKAGEVKKKQAVDFRDHYRGRALVLEFIKHLVKWENSNNEEIVGKARKLIAAAHKFLHPDLPAPRPDTFWVYVLKCNDDSFYIGQTDDIPRRWKEHWKGEVSWTKSRLGVTLIHYESFATREEAVKREKDLKTGFGRKWLKREYEAGRLACLRATHGQASRQAGAEGDSPKVLDPFAGGGAIPLEALRLGCEAHAIDLNTVAHLIELCTLVYGRSVRVPRPQRPWSQREALDGRPGHQRSPP